MKIRSAMVIVVLAGLALLLGGCGGGGGGGDTGGTPSGSTGTLRVAITDQAAYGSVVLAIREIRVVPAGEEGEETGSGLPLIATFEEPRVVDVLTLSYEELLLGQAPVPAGEYSQVRLVLAPNPAEGDPVNYVTMADAPDVKIPLRTPSGQQSGLKIVGDYVVEEGVTSTIVLDFDPARAIVVTGNGRYILKPTGVRLTQTISVEPVYGALAGTVAPAAAWPTAVVTAIPEGGTEAAATSAVSAEDGSFRLPLEPGVYYLQITADGYNSVDTSLTDPVVLYTVVVNEDFAVGEIALTAAE